LELENMAAMKIPPFLKTRLVEEQINEFLDKISEAALAFEMGFSEYLGADPTRNVPRSSSTSASSSAVPTICVAPSRHPCIPSSSFPTLEETS